MNLRSKTIVSKYFGLMLLLGSMFSLLGCDETSHTIAPTPQTSVHLPESNQTSRVVTIEEYYNKNPAEWARVASTSDAEVNIDLNSIEYNENLVTYYVRYDQHTIDEYGTKMILSRHIVNCRLGAYQVIETTGLNQQGVIIAYSDTPNPVTAIRSGTIGETLYRTACHNMAYLDEEMVRQQQALSEEILRLYVQDIESNRRFLSSLSSSFSINYDSYTGPCQYPSNLDSRNYRCGGRAASERPGGYEF